MADTQLGFKIRKPVAEIPKNGVTHPYVRVFKAITAAPPEAPFVPLMCESEEDATKLATRLSSYFKDSVTIRKPRGSRVVYVAARGAAPAGRKKR